MSYNDIERLYFEGSEYIDEKFQEAKLDHMHHLQYEMDKEINTSIEEHRMKIAEAELNLRREQARMQSQIAEASAEFDMDQFRPTGDRITATRTHPDTSYTLEPEVIRQFVEILRNSNGREQKEEPKLSEVDKYLDRLGAL